MQTPVRSAKRVDSESAGGQRWQVNDGAEGEFDAVLVTIGTCGKPKWIYLDGMPKGMGEGISQSRLFFLFATTLAGPEHEDSDQSKQQTDVFTKPIIHSSELDSDAVSEETIKGK
jgi:hypothetical protein